MKTDYSFDRRQLLAADAVFLLAPALRLVPSGTLELAGGAAWLCAPLALPFIALYILFLRRFLSLRADGEGLAELILRAAGKRAGKTLLFLFVAWFVLYGGFMLRSGAERIITTMYPNSSEDIFIFTMGALCLTAALDSARALLRAAKLFLPAVFGVLFLVLFFALFSLREENFTPLAVSDALNAGKGAAAVADVFLMPMYTGLFLVPLKRETNSSARTAVLWAFGLTALLALLMTDIIGLFGSELAARLTHPFFSLVKNLVFFRALERVEALVVSLWVFSDFVVISMCLYAAQYSLRLIMGKNARYAGEHALDMRSARWCIWLCAAVSVALAFIIARRPMTLNTWSKLIIPAINLAFALIVLPIIYIVGRTKKTL